MTDEQQPPAQKEGEQKSTRPQKIYLKDVSFEAPNSHAIFMKGWQPELELEVGNSIALTNDGLHEVVLELTVTVKVNGETAYLAEVHQAGLFSITGYEEEEEEYQRIYHIPCNRMLYPYACAALSDLVTRGGFQQLLLSPIDWRKIYQRSLEESSSVTLSTADS